MNDTATPVAETAKRVPTAKSDVDSNKLVMTFATGDSLNVTVQQLADSGVDGLVAELALTGLASILRSSYGAVRDDAAKAYAAASKRLSEILEKGLETVRESAGPSGTMLDFAIAALAKYKNRDEAAIRAVIDAYQPKVVNGETLSVDDQKKALVNQVKNSPATAAIFAEIKAKAQAPKKAKAEADAFGEF